jgi:hypothetical protein
MDYYFSDYSTMQHVEFNVLEDSAISNFMVEEAYGKGSHPI